MLKGRKIVLGVCGSIAAYKSALLIRLLVKEGVEVKVVMTEAATHFISPLTLATLSGNPVLTHFYKPDSGEWQSHVELGLWADLLLIAPVSANTLAHFAHGICDNLLDAVYLSAKCPVMLAPAMDVDMYAHPATRKNREALVQNGNQVLPTGEGELASGLTGEGRMLEPEQIIEKVRSYWQTESQTLQGYKVLVTAGPTYEAIDPVRFLGNHSSGKMGYALAEAMANAGADVILVSGPTHLSSPHPSVNVIRVTTANQMMEICQSLHVQQQIIVFAAAVADYRPAKKLERKHKKEDDHLEIHLEKNPDIALVLGKDKKQGQWHIGFALETHDEEINALEKMQKKNFDLVVLNSLNDSGAGFGHDTNKIRIIHKNNKIHDFELKGKKEVAGDILAEIIKLIQ